MLNEKDTYKKVIAKASLVLVIIFLSLHMSASFVMAIESSSFIDCIGSLVIFVIDIASISVWLSVRNLKIRTTVMYELVSGGF